MSATFPSPTHPLTATHTGGDSGALPEIEFRKLFGEWNATQAEFPADSTVHRLFEEQVDRTPEGVAAIHEGRRWTYRELDERANQVAHALIGRGVKPETPVGICLRRSLDLAAALLGTLKAGGACVPLDPNYPDERLKFMVEDAQAPVLLTQPGLVSHLPEHGAEIIALSEEWSGFKSESTERPAAGTTPSNLAYLIYTSGSTGKPKGVALEHRSLVNHHTAAIKLYGLTPADRVLQFASISFDIAVEEMFPAWLSGASVIYRPDDLSLEIGTFLEWIGEHRVTVLDLPTAYWHEMVHELPECGRKTPRDLRLVIVGGEKAQSAAYSEWRNLTSGKVRWINTYGPTETTVIATAYEPDASLPVPAELPIGRPIANTQTYILNANLEPVGIGEPGELFIGGAGLARGYWNRPDTTNEKFLADPFSADPHARMYRTGDLAQWLEDGQIEFRGRADDQVKIRGYRVELGEIESALARHENVGHVAVVAREFATGDKRLIAYLTAPSGKPPATAELRAHLSSNLPDYMIPAAFVTLDSMPLTPNGKVNRKALPALDLTAIPGQAERAPRTPLEAKIGSVWESVLGTRNIGLDDHFFEIGGNSLLAVRLTSRLEKALDQKLPINLLIEAPTIEKMAAKLSSGGGLASRWTSLVPIQPHGSLPPFFCVHGVGGTVIRLQWLAKYLGTDQPFYGLQAQGLDGEHPCLNTVNEMAAHYLEEIRTVQAHGPYFFGGFSLGGSVAIEMARMLEEAGERVAFLALFDTFAGRYLSKAELMAKLMRQPLRAKVAYSAGKAWGYAAGIGNRFAMLFLPDALKRVREACNRAADAYEPHATNVPLTLFRSTQRSLRATSGDLGGWGPWAQGGVEVHEVEGTHESLILEPRVQVLARELSDCLRRARLNPVSEAGEVFHGSSAAR
jgi:aspartate racemase